MTATPSTMLRKNGAGAIALIGECADIFGEARGGLIQRASQIGKFILGIFEFERAEIAGGDAAGEILEAFDAHGKSARKHERDGAAEEQDEERNDHEAAAHYGDRATNFFHGHGHAQDHAGRRRGAGSARRGRRDRDLIPAAAHGFGFAIGECVAHFGQTVGIFAAGRFFGGIDEHAPSEAITVTRAPLCDIQSAQARKAARSSDLRRARLRGFLEGGEFIFRGADKFGAEDARGEKIHGGQNGQQEKQIGQS